MVTIVTMKERQRNRESEKKRIIRMMKREGEKERNGETEKIGMMSPY